MQTLTVFHTPDRQMVPQNSDQTKDQMALLSLLFILWNNCHNIIWLTRVVFNLMAELLRLNILCYFKAHISNKIKYLNSCNSKLNKCLPYKSNKNHQNFMWGLKSIFKGTRRKTTKGKVNSFHWKLCFDQQRAVELFEALWHRVQSCF